MELGFLVFAIIMACGALGAVIVCGVAEAAEAFDISRRGWLRGRHHHAHLVGRH